MRMGYSKMNVVCINNKTTRSTIEFLTIGKVYETNGGPAAQYQITCDDGVSRTFSIEDFVTLDRWREMQLNILVK